MAQGKARHLLKWLVGALVLMLVLAAAGLAVAFRTFNGPGPLSEPVVVLIEPGEGLRRVAGKLEKTGAVRSSFIFEWGTRLMGAGRGIRAGEYAMPAAAGMAEILRRLQSGEVVVHRLTVPEGLTSAQIMRLIAEAPALRGDPGPVPAEGSLLPETYHYVYGDTREELVARMQTEMRALLAESWADRAPDLPLDSPQDALILASVIEKETALPAERPLIAGVFVNRLRKGMRLQSDPTVIYGVARGEDLGRPLTNDDLAADNAYNTYRRDGLPPTPIANPGRDSVRAALRPLETDALYFVADGSGGHAFAATFEEHRKNVERWRRIEKERRDQTQHQSE